MATHCSSLAWRILWTEQPGGLQPMAQYYEDGRKINDTIMAEIMENVAKMEEINGKKFGDLENPLLVSVRSGARASMPGSCLALLRSEASNSYLP